MNTDRSAPILSVIMRQAELYGYRPEGSNPCVGIRRYRRKGRERFLSEPELHRLARVLERHEDRHPREVAFIRLLLLTGCRRNEIVRLCREEVSEDRLEPGDSKTGPRTVLLNGPAGEIVRRRMAEGNGPWLFPSVGDLSRHRCDRLMLWYRARREAGIEDVRLHDLHHTVASQATMNGVPRPVVARLLGHSNVGMTIRYAHVGDKEIEAAAERAGQALGTLIGRPPKEGGPVAFRVSGCCAARQAASGPSAHLCRTAKFSAKLVHVLVSAL